MLIKEEKNKNNGSLNVDSYYSISKQIPFFGCPDKLMEREASDSFAMYNYCKEFGVPPHEGSFSQQPNKWIETAFLIRALINKWEAIQMERSKNG